MTNNLFEAQYDLTKKSKIKRFYESNKILIYFSVIIIIIIFASFAFYFDSKEKKRILLSENYIKAQIHIENGKKNEALDTLKKIIFANDSTYSTLSFFLILNQNLINEPNEISELYDYILENNQFDKELRNLLIYKKALFNSNFVNESELLDSIKPLISSDTLWKPHALVLAGDYFASKGENVKAAEFYQKVLSIKNLHIDFYSRAQNKLAEVNYD